MNNGKTFESHNLTVTDRQHSELTGIDDVLSFDEREITVHSALGDLMIEGDELKIENFSGEKGILAISGKINGLFYLEMSEKKRFSKKRNSKQ